MKAAGYDIAVFAGDGTGPEVVREGLKILAALAEGGPAPWRTTEHPGGGQHYLATGREWEPEGEAAAHRADAILLGAVGVAGGDPAERGPGRAGPRARTARGARPVRERAALPA
ncbi:Isocitrate/isopropylmalate dehydrogenase, partial [mine drainage metagenome]